MIKLSNGEKIFQAIAVVFVSLMCFTMLYPFIHQLSISLSTPKEAVRMGFHFYPKEFSYEAYKLAFQSYGLWNGFANSMFRTVVGTVLSLVFMLMAAYPLSKKDFPLRKFYTMLIIFTMFFGGGLIPTFLLIRGIGLYDSIWVYILPGLISTFYMLILRNFLMSTPRELEDSAKMDGANEFQIVLKIIIPLSKPVLATLGLWTAVNHWNAWFDSLIYIQDSSKQVLQIFLRKLVIENNTSDLNQIIQTGYENRNVSPESVKAAVLMITILPMVALFPYLQKFFTKGIMVGSLKG